MDIGGGQPVRAITDRTASTSTIAGTQVIPISARQRRANGWRRAAWTWAGWLWGLLLCFNPLPARADAGPTPVAYLCDGEPLTAFLVKGPMDEPAIPDPSSGPVPIGGNVVLAWHGISLQLPRTNNAGPASFSDGKWWWSLEDPVHPRFRLRRPLGDIQDFSCERAGS
ncbi:MAG: hypothetical protein VKL58_05765 [Cyanobacteriota bacterium]|nr:hypothetical protein [Cyanobacteriota bacterium]